MDPQPLITPYLDGFADSVPLVVPAVQAPVPVPVSPPPPIPVPRPATVNVWGTRFAVLDMQQAIELSDAVVQRRVPELMITANLNYLMLTEQYPELEVVNQRAIAILADGFPIVRRSRWTSTPLPERVAGSDMILELARLSAAKGYRMYFLGAAPGVAQRAANKLQELVPGFQVAGCYSPPFRPLTAEEHQQVLADIRAAGTDILLVAFGQPKGELWIDQNLAELNVPLSIQLGASFDFLAGTAQRAPQLWRKLGCEWLYRACSDPRRLLPRYAANLVYLGRRLIRDLLTQRPTGTLGQERRA